MKKTITDTDILSLCKTLLEEFSTGTGFLSFDWEKLLKEGDIHSAHEKTNSPYSYFEAMQSPHINDSFYQYDIPDEHERNLINEVISAIYTVALETPYLRNKDSQGSSSVFMSGVRDFACGVLATMNSGCGPHRLKLIETVFDYAMDVKDSNATYMIEEFIPYIEMDFASLPDLIRVTLFDKTYNSSLTGLSGWVECLYSRQLHPHSRGSMTRLNKGLNFLINKTRQDCDMTWFSDHRSKSRFIHGFIDNLKLIEGMTFKAELTAVDSLAVTELMIMTAQYCNDEQMAKQTIQTLTDKFIPQSVREITSSNHLFLRGTRRDRWVQSWEAIELVETMTEKAADLDRLRTLSPDTCKLLAQWNAVSAIKGFQSHEPFRQSKRLGLKIKRLFENEDLLIDKDFIKGLGVKGQAALFDMIDNPDIRSSLAKHGKIKREMLYSDLGI